MANNSLVVAGIGRKQTSDFGKRYFLIGVDGKVHVPVKDEYVYLGNLLYDELSEFKKPEILKIDKNIANAKVSYGLR